jgi:lipoprotein-anchoring transpeptidase ErfK/SrfK
MSDIFVRPYDEPHKPNKRFVKTGLIVLAVTAAVIGLCLWMDSRSAKAPEVKPSTQEKTGSQPVKAPVPAPAPIAAAAPVASPVAPAVATPDSRAQQLFTRAQSAAAAGNLEEARDLLSEVIATAATDESLKNNAMRVQGRINIQLFLSATPTPEKKTYVVQPGDSLDKIARVNKTTVDLIRKMNSIKNDVIYPGGRLLMPAAPFVVQVDKSAKTVDLTMNGKLFKRYIVGLGVNGKTPIGKFQTVVHQVNPDWTPPGGGVIKFGDPSNILGTRWMSIQDATRPDIKGFGIHGTPLRDSIGADTSNGCVRMLNEDVEELYLLIPRGTEVIISE